MTQIRLNIRTDMAPMGSMAVLQAYSHCVFLSDHRRENT
jgi:hypothetical protein